MAEPTSLLQQLNLSKGSIESRGFQVTRTKKGSTQKGEEEDMVSASSFQAEKALIIQSLMQKQLSISIISQMVKFVWKRVAYRRHASHRQSSEQRMEKWKSPSSFSLLSQTRSGGKNRRHSQTIYRQEAMM